MPESVIPPNVREHFSLHTINNSLPTFSFDKPQIVSCRPQSPYGGDFISKSGTKAEVLYKISNAKETWYRITLDVAPDKNAPTNYAKYSSKMIEVCSDFNDTDDLDQVTKLRFWIKESVVPENIRNSVKDYELYAKSTLGSHSFYVGSVKVVTGALKMCPSENCPVQWIGGAPACGSGKVNSCGMATVVEQKGDWYKVIISNIDSDHFDVSGGEGWLQKSYIPDFIKIPVDN
jgi:hypothetical protein